MAHVDEWKALSSRIRGLQRAVELHAQFLLVNRSDTYNRAARLREHCQSALNALEAYAERHRFRVPTTVIDSIKTFASRHKSLIHDTSGTRDSQEERVWAAIVALGGLETELSFLLADGQQVIRRTSERAFVHLERSIVADPDVRQKWIKAFEQGEVACERLGGAHLLAHGIFAFKVDGEGERTDLILQEPLRDATESERFADGFVLTEWKKAKEEKDAAAQFERARKQAALYAKGVLGASELASYRYLVIVSRRRIAVPGDMTEGPVTYRHVNISVDPQSPSKSNSDMAAPA
jgi:hypothetical protein